MVEMFRQIVGRVSQEDYENIKGRLNTFCKKEIQFIRELQFQSGTEETMSEKFRIVRNRLDEEHIYLIKTREGNNKCLMQNTVDISEEEYNLIVECRYHEMKESENELIRDLAWHMELDDYEMSEIVEYIQEKYISQSGAEQYVFKSLMVEIEGSADEFLDENLTAAGDIDYDTKYFTYMKKINLPLIMKQAV